MFLAISIDLASPDSKKEVARVLNEYGIKKNQEHLYESFDFLTRKLGNLKRDLAKCVDMYDKIRLYQYPLEDSFKISYVDNGKWKRLSIK